MSKTTTQAKEQPRLTCPECKRQYRVKQPFFSLEETIKVLWRHRFVFPFCVCGHKQMEDEG